MSKRKNRESKGVSRHESCRCRSKEPKNSSCREKFFEFAEAVIRLLIVVMEALRIWQG